MLIGQAIYSILSTDDGVSAIVVDRIFPNVVPQLVKTYPLIVYRGGDAKCDVTMDGPGSLTYQIIQVACLAPNPDDANALGIKVMSALRGKRGTYGGIRLSNVFYDSENESDETVQDMGQDALIYIREVALKCWFYLS